MTATDPSPTPSFALLGWPDEGPRIRLDYRAFSYAGKFVTGSAGIAVLRADGRAAPGWEPQAELPDAIEPDDFADDVVAAVAFNADRTAPTVLWLRYVTVHTARRGEGHGPRLVSQLVPLAAERGYELARIAVNNPFAYEALYRAGFGFTGRTTGIAELVLERPVARPAARPAEPYRAGLDRYRERDLSAAERRFLDERGDADPPSLVARAGQGLPAQSGPGSSGDPNSHF